MQVQWAEDKEWGDKQCETKYEKCETKNKDRYETKYDDKGKHTVESEATIQQQYNEVYATECEINYEQQFNTEYDTKCE